MTIASNSSKVHPEYSVRRYSQKEKKYRNVRQPNSLHQYNKFIGGVNPADQNISLYKNWYFLLDTTEQNAWQFFKIKGGKHDHLKFRR